MKMNGFNSITLHMCCIPFEVFNNLIIKKNYIYQIQEHNNAKKQGKCFLSVLSR